MRATSGVPQQLRARPGAPSGQHEGQRLLIREQEAFHQSHVKRLLNAQMLQRIGIKDGELVSVELKPTLSTAFFLLAGSNKGSLVGGPGFEPGASRSRTVSTGSLAVPIAPQPSLVEHALAGTAPCRSLGDPIRRCEFGLRRVSAHCPTGAEIDGPDVLRPWRRWLAAVLGPSDRRRLPPPPGRGHSVLGLTCVRSNPTAGAS